MQKKLIIILSVIVGVGAIIGGVLIYKKKQLEKMLAGTSGTINDFRNFLMSEYVAHVRGKNKDDLETWTKKVMDVTAGGTTLTPENILTIYDEIGAPRWASTWIKKEAEKSNSGKTYPKRVEDAIKTIVEWQATQTNWDKLVEESQVHGYWFRRMAEKYPRITDKLTFLENIHVTGINVN